MSLFRTATKSSRLIRPVHQHQGLPSLLSPRRFATETQQPSQDTTSDSFLRTPATGLVYGKLFGTTKHTTKTDVLNLLQGCNLSTDDVKVCYDHYYETMSMSIQFPTQLAYNAGIRSISRKGRFRLDKADRSQWETLKPYDGKAILLQGIPRNALMEDVQRFLSGCQYDASSMQMFFRQAFPDAIRMALVHFPSQALAMHAFITKNQGFCLNSQIFVRILH
ncbi:unnamed protein product [Coffea canephora]|uniref:Uncharacterized protein n=1 Tax=Coffea canephora TaxID=49390 RepID=A0A068UEM2_COFCA|nr:unnamed protein product [Coffea canephora]